MMSTNCHEVVKHEVGNEQSDKFIMWYCSFKSQFFSKNQLNQKNYERECCQHD
jgi:hypothetical protein